MAHMHVTACGRCARGTHLMHHLPSRKCDRQIIFEESQASATINPYLDPGCPAFLGSVLHIYRVYPKKGRTCRV